MDLHPMFVHFPVALLGVYAILEIIPSLRKNATGMYVKSYFALIGVFGAFASLSTGDAASHQVKDFSLRPLIEMHELWAGTATTIFGILAAAYVIHFIAEKYPLLFSKSGLSKVWSLLLRLKDVVLFSPFVYVLAVLGLVAITVTGALGGAIVYGPDSDPIISVIYGILLG